MRAERRSPAGLQPCLAHERHSARAVVAARPHHRLPQWYAAFAPSRRQADETSIAELETFVRQRSQNSNLGRQAANPRRGHEDIASAPGFRGQKRRATMRRGDLLSRRVCPGDAALRPREPNPDVFDLMLRGIRTVGGTAHELLQRNGCAAARPYSLSTVEVIRTGPIFWSRAFAGKSTWVRSPQRWRHLSANVRPNRFRVDAARR